MAERDDRSNKDVIRRLNEVEENLKNRIERVEDRIEVTTSALKKDTSDILAAIAGVTPPPPPEEATDLNSTWTIQ